MVDTVEDRLNGLVLKGLPKENTLEASLEAYTKPNLVKLAELNDFDVKKSWNKGQMIEVIIENLKDSLAERLTKFEEEQLETLKEIADETTGNADLESEAVTSAVSQGLLYVAVNEEAISYSMPAEVKDEVNDMIAKKEALEKQTDAIVEEDSQPVRTFPFPVRPRRPKKVQQRIVGKKIGRNEPCPCGSGKKYKKCCLA